MLSAATLLNDFISLPRIDFGKIWSWLKVNAPARPQDSAKRFYHVSGGPYEFVHPDDLIGYVYITKDDKAIYWPGAQDDARALEARYLQKNPTELRLPTDRAVIFDAKIGETAEPISPEHRRELLCAYYGEQKAKAFLANTLG